jgi:hypothetical protein
VIYDVSSVTDTLLGLISSAWATAPLWQELGTGVSFQPTFTGLAPDVIRENAGAQLSMYLYHLEQNPSLENLFWTAAEQAGPAVPLSYQPLALDLFYLLSAYSQGNYLQEQQAMSIAMRVLHGTPIVRGGTGGQAWELTLTMEHRSYNEISQLWQATTAPIRLGAVYRAAVVFIQPDTPPTPAKTPTTLGLQAGPGVPPVTGPEPPDTSALTVQVTDTGLPTPGSSG